LLLLGEFGLGCDLRHGELALFGAGL